MAFLKIDRSTWKRKEYFEHYFSDLPCTYSLTTKLNITPLRTSGLSLYPAMLYALTTVVNRHEEFRTALDEQGAVGIFDEMHPCYTVFHKDTETFSNIWTEYDSDYTTFLAIYKSDMGQYGGVQGILAKSAQPENTFPVSMLPWMSFDGLNLNLQKGFAYLLPIFTIGKFFEQDGVTLLPIAVQVHHAVCDGFHVSRFLAEVQAVLNELSSAQEMHKL